MIHPTHFVSYIRIHIYDMGIIHYIPYACIHISYILLVKNILLLGKTVVVHVFLTYGCFCYHMAIVIIINNPNKMLIDGLAEIKVERL